MERFRGAIEQALQGMPVLSGGRDPVEPVKHHLDEGKHELSPPHQLPDKEPQRIGIAGAYGAPQ